MSAYPNLFEVLDDNGDAIAQEIDRKSKVIIKEAPASKKKEAPKKEEKKPELHEKATDGFEVQGQNRPPRQPKAEKTSPAVAQASGRGGRGGRGGFRGDRPPRAEGDAPRRHDGEPRPPRGDRPPRQEGDFENRPPRQPRQEGDERPPRQEGDRPYRRQPRQEGDQPRQPREPRQEGDFENRPPRQPRQEGDRPYRQRNYEDNSAPQDAADESGEQRANYENRPRGRGGRGGRGRGFFSNRANSENGHELAEGAPIEADAQAYSRPQRRPREDRLTDEKGFVQAKHRAYDRRSATGRSGDDVKRSGRGPNNWGAVGEESLDVETDATAFDKAVDDAIPADVETPQAEGEAAAPAREAKPEEDKTRTLKEYRESLATELAQVELPAPRQASTDKWNNNKILRKDANNIKLSVIAPTKEKKKGETTTTIKPKAKKVVVDDLLKFKAAPREGQERRRDFQNERPQNDRPHRNNKQHPAAAKPASPVVEAPKVDKNSPKDFPALAPVKI